MLTDLKTWLDKRTIADVQNRHLVMGVAAFGLLGTYLYGRYYFNRTGMNPNTELALLAAPFIFTGVGAGALLLKR